MDCVENDVTRGCRGHGKGNTAFIGNCLGEMLIRLRLSVGKKWEKKAYK